MGEDLVGATDRTSFTGEGVLAVAEPAAVGQPALRHALAERRAAVPGSGC